LKVDNLGMMMSITETMP